MQSNAALVEETAACASSLRGAALRMAAQVDGFQLPGEKVAQLVEGIDVNSIIDAHRQWKVKLRDAMKLWAKVDVATLSPNTPFTQATRDVVMVLSAAKRLGFV